MQRPFGTFANLRQTTTVLAYLNKFEQLQGMLDALPPKYLLENFLDGLKDEIRFDVLAARPVDFREAVSLAKLFESKWWHTKKTSKSGSTTTSTANKGFSQNAQSNSVASNVKCSSSAGSGIFKHRNILDTLAKKKGLTPNEIIERRRKNLCFGCNEQWHVGHHCKNQVYVIEGIMNLELGYDSEDTLETEDAITADHDSPRETTLAITLQAMCGIPTLHTIRVQGSIHSKVVYVLIDSGSTHSFINTALAKKLDLTVHDSKDYEVLVANGDKLKGTGICKQVPLSCQGCTMSIDLLLLPIEGCQVVLGAQWMRELEDVTLNFKKMQVKFHHMGKPHVWQGITTDDTKIVNEKTIAKESQQGQLTSMLYCTQTNIHLDSNPIAPLPPDLQQLLGQYSKVTQPQLSLPPHRAHDHKIPLIPGAKPVCIRPYRHSHFLKNELEKLIKDMLNTGIIRPSTSEYASPVVMVRKKDGT